ncbi:hypothetical protein [Stutzerimonas tarimensis]|uniref:Uncharacterized protein n=1 Tax=Stutzerimonas tarimensis TaxID=1507735 RepID=A0ABV7T9U6_9GAMM
MRHTLVAAFKTTLDANRTRGDLMARGIPREQVHSVGADSAEIHGYGSPYSASGDTLVRDHHESRTGEFFQSLFGKDTDDTNRHHAQAYPEAVRRGSTVIAVDVDNENDLAKVRDALEYNGAISIDDGGAGTAGLQHATSPYAGATGGDSHLDKHFDRPGASTVGATGTTAVVGRETAAEREAGATGRDSSPAPTDIDGGHGIGMSAKRAGTDYPSTTATSSPTGAGVVGQGISTTADDIGYTSSSDVGDEDPRLTGATAPSGNTGASPAVDSDLESPQRGMCNDRVCVIRRSDDLR